LKAAGFVDIEITPTFQAAESMHSAIVRVIKPWTLSSWARLLKRS